MHLIYDENGNPMPHGHEHEHTHEHTFSHSHVHSHEHGHEEDHNHTHDHVHEHSHTHSHEGCEDKSCDGCQGCAEETADKTAALLDYMLKHNEHHAAELDQLAEKLRADGKTEAADQLKKAVDEFQKGNLYLGLALSLAKSE